MTQITVSPPRRARRGWPVLVMMNGDAAQHQVPAVEALGRTGHGEEVSLSAGLLGQPGLCRVLLLESSQQIKHHNTHPSPNGPTHTEPRHRSPRRWAEARLSLKRVLGPRSSSVPHPPLATRLSTGLFPLTMRGDSEQWSSSV